VAAVPERARRAGVLPDKLKPAALGAWRLEQVALRVVRRQAVASVVLRVVAVVLRAALLVPGEATPSGSRRLPSSMSMRVATTTKPRATSSHRPT